MLTKEQINSIRHVVTCDDLHLTECASAELRRLALLGLERDTRAERVGRAVLRELSDQGVELRGLRDGYASEGDIIAVIADAMEDSDD